MNNTQDKSKQETDSNGKPVKYRHPYPKEHPKEVQRERMRSFSERAAKFLENLNANGKQNPG
ncbi:MAG: hypothetical protein ABR530_10650 [Pyrinomonadaceae bacterium]